MEASRPTSQPPGPNPSTEDDERRGGRSVYIAIAIVAALTGIFFAAVAISLAGTPTCEDLLNESPLTGGECTEKSQSNKVVTVILAAATALASLVLLAAAIGSARVRAGSPLLRPLALAILVAGLVTLAL